MDIDTLRLIYFSPTRTTQKVLEGISAGFKADSTAHIDLTPSTAQGIDAGTIKDGLTIIGAPVYAGRIPATVARRISRIKADGAPAVVIVLYGNREFEDALGELRDLAAQCGFTPIAGGAFIGEHSYATADYPIALNRPDGEDLQKCEKFGALVKAKLSAAGSIDQISIPKIPGNYPYIEHKSPKNISPAILDHACIQCGTCVDVCPVAAITLEDCIVIESAICIRCCACVKNCPSEALVMQDAHILKTVQWLWDNYRQRKEPTFWVY